MKEIEDLVLETIKDREDLFLVDVKVSGNKGSQKVLIHVDGDSGLSIDDCSMISRKVGSMIDERDIIRDGYTLEVSSPGVGTPLKFPRQYAKNVGRKLRLQYEGKEMKGELISIKDDVIVLNTEKKIKKKIYLDEVEIPINKIDKAKVLVSF